MEMRYEFGVVRNGGFKVFENLRIASVLNGISQCQGRTDGGSGSD